VFLLIFAVGLLIVNLGPPVSTARGIGVLAAWAVVLLVMAKRGMLGS
jgi:hypothetical protein